MGWITEESVFDSRQWQNVFLFFIVPKPALMAIQSPIQQSAVGKAAGV
jgi:hypothetical protein